MQASRERTPGTHSNHSALGVTEVLKRQDIPVPGGEEHSQGNGPHPTPPTPAK